MSICVPRLFSRQVFALLLAIWIYPHSAGSAQGLPGGVYCDFSGDGPGLWEVSEGKVIDMDQGRLVVLPERNPSGDFRTVLAQEGGLILNTGAYPILAIKLEVPAESHVSLRTNLGYYNNIVNNAKKIECPTGGDIYYWNIPRGSFGNFQMPENSTVAFSGIAVEVSDRQGQRSAYSPSEFYWIRSFGSEYEIKSAIGLMDDDFSDGCDHGWKVTLSGVKGDAQLRDRKLHVVTAEYRNDTYRADIDKIGNVFLHAGDFPIVAIMMEKPVSCNTTFHTGLGDFNKGQNNATHIELPNSRAGIYYWDISAGNIGGTVLPADRVTDVDFIQFKISDIIPQDNNVPHYDVYWVKTFRNIEELLAETGLIDDVFTHNELHGWETKTTGAVLSAGGDRASVRPAVQADGSYRCDIQKELVTFNTGSYPLLAVRLDKPAAAKLTLDTNYGSFNKGVDTHKTVTLPDGSQVCYWDLSKGTLGDLRLSPDATLHTEYCRFKISGMQLTEDTVLPCDIFWVKTFSSEKDLSMLAGFGAAGRSIPIAVFLLAGLFVIAAGTLYLFVRKKERSAITPGREPEVRNVLAPREGAEPLQDVFMPEYQRVNRSAVYLCGGLAFYDRGGKEITYQLSPVLKQLFLAIFLHQEKTERGVTSQRIDELLWADKSFESARNNRNVNMSKLKAFLEQVGDIHLQKEGSFWTMDTGQVYSDYSDIMSLSRNYRETVPGREDMVRFLSLVSHGEILPAFQVDWIDEFKTGFANRVIDTLEYFLTIPVVLGDKALQYTIADTIFTYDHLSDKAVGLKCSLLYRDGKKGLAKKVYDTFAKDYKETLGEKYPVPFDRLIL